MVKKERVKKIKQKCFHCKKEIDLLDRQVYLTTVNEGKTIESCNFHLDCWKLYFNERVNKRARENVQAIQLKLVNLFNSPMLKPLLDQVAGSDVAMNMLKTPLNKDKETKITKNVIVDMKRVIKKIKNGRKKRSGSIKKNKMQ